MRFVRAMCASLPPSPAMISIRVRATECCRSLLVNHLPRLGPRQMHDKFRISSLRTLCAMVWATGLSACAPGSDPISVSAASPITPGAQTCRPDHALLAPQSAPDCGFTRANLKTLDPDQWTRLKLEYELKCYKEAEKTARNRLRLLQAACEVRPVQ